MQIGEVKLRAHVPSLACGCLSPPPPLLRYPSSPQYVEEAEATGAGAAAALSATAASHCPYWLYKFDMTESE